jgi:hypothetical protein
MRNTAGIIPRMTVDYRAAQAMLHAMGEAPSRRAAQAAAQAGARVIADEGKEIVRGIQWKGKSTGALLASIGIDRLKDDSRRAGVQRQYRHQRTGKIPNMYAWKVVDVHFNFMEKAKSRKMQAAQAAMHKRYMEKLSEEMRRK